MRFCPFCSEELNDDAAHCVYCGKRLPSRTPATGTPIQPAKTEPDAVMPPPPPTAAEPELPKKTVFGFAAPDALPPPPPPPSIVPPRTPPPDVPPVAPAAEEDVPSLASLTADIEPLAPPAPPPIAPPPPLPPPTPAPAVDLQPVPPVPGPTTGAPAGSKAAAALAALAPMPTEGPVGLFGCLPYWFAVLGARLKRSGVISAFRRESADEQRRLEEILRDLGRQARKVELQHPPVDPVMSQLRQLESQRAGVESANAGITGQLKEAEATFERVSTDCNGRIQAAQQELASTQAALNEKNNGLRGVKAQIAQVDRELGRLASALRAKTAQGAKAPDAAKQQSLEQEAEALTSQIEQLEGQRATLEAQAGQVEAPVAELTAQLADIRGRLQTAQQELAAARQQLAGTKRSLGAEGAKAGQELTRLDREMAQQFLEIGRLLETQRIAHPDFEELFGRIDEAKQTLGGHEQQIAALESERESYDRNAAKKGLILLLSAVGLVLVLAVGLIILFTVVLD